MVCRIISKDLFAEVFEEFCRFVSIYQRCDRFGKKSRLIHLFGRERSERRFAGPVDVARDRLRPQVRLETRVTDGPWRAALPADARHEGAFWYFTLPETGIEPLLRALIEGNAGILSLSIERAGLHDAFVAIAGEAAAKALEEGPLGENGGDTP